MPLKILPKLQVIKDKAVKAWERVKNPFPQSHHYVVYAATPDTFSGFKTDGYLLSHVIHNTIAQRENNHPARGSLGGDFKPGSFNFERIVAATDINDAVTQAKANGLKYEPVKTVLARHINTQLSADDELAFMRTFENLEKSFSNLGKNGSHPR